MFYTNELILDIKKPIEHFTVPQVYYPAANDGPAPQTFGKFIACSDFTNYKYLKYNMHYYKIKWIIFQIILLFLLKINNTGFFNLFNLL